MAKKLRNLPNQEEELTAADVAEMHLPDLADLGMKLWEEFQRAGKGAKSAIKTRYNLVAEELNRKSGFKSVHYL